MSSLASGLVTVNDTQYPLCDVFYFLQTSYDFVLHLLQNNHCLKESLDIISFATLSFEQMCSIFFKQISDKEAFDIDNDPE